MSEYSESSVHSMVVANRFLRMASDESLAVHQMKLHKLVYFAHGWHLGVYEEPLTSDNPEAWIYGPLFKDLWLATRHFRNNPLPERLDISEYENTGFTDTQDMIIRAIHEVYKGFKDFELSELSHLKGGPWHEVFEVHGRERQEIPREMILEYFGSIAKKEKLKAA